MRSKASIVFSIIFYSIIAILLSLLLVFLLNNKAINLRNIIHMRTKDNYSRVLREDTQYDETFKKIVIDSKSSNISFLHSDSEVIKLVIYSEDNNVEISTDNKILKINVDGVECKFLCLNVKMSKIEVFLPDDYKNVISIINDFGDISIDGFDNAKISIENEAGNIYTGAFKYGVISNKFGNIKTMGKVEELSIKNEYGDIEVYESYDLSVTNKFGDIKVDTVSEKLYVKNNFGDIKINKLNILRDSSIENNLGDIKIYNTNSIHVSAKTNLGSIKIKNNNKNSGINLDIKNNLGDIKIK